RFSRDWSTDVCSSDPVSGAECRECAGDRQHPPPFAGYREWWWVRAVAGALAALGAWDLLQRRSTLRRNYPLLAHFRYGLESIGPEIRQYFIESDTEEAPLPRAQRALAYQRSTGAKDVVP